MQRTETLRHSCLTRPPSGKPNRTPCTLGQGPKAGPSFLEQGGNGETEEGESQGGEEKGPTRKGPDKEVRPREQTRIGMTASGLCSDEEATWGGLCAKGPRGFRAEQAGPRASLEDLGWCPATS